jgi:hypothetical protein
VVIQMMLVTHQVNIYYHSNNIGGVMVSMLASSAVARSFEPGRVRIRD